MGNIEGYESALSLSSCFWCGIGDGKTKGVKSSGGNSEGISLNNPFLFGVTMGGD